MPTVIMPKMGDGMEEGTLLKWLKAAGDTVAEGDPIAEIETDKVSLEISAEAAGTLTEQIASEGDSIPVGKPIAVILGEGETAESPSRPQAAEAESAVGSAVVTEERAPTHADADGAAADSLAQAQGAATNGVTPGTSTEVAPAHAAPARQAGERLRASPLVKRLAAEHGIDLQQVAGTGPGGRIVKDDIAPFLTGAAPIPAAAPASPALAPEPQPAAPAVPAAAAQPAATQAPAPAAADGRPAGVPREMSRIRRTTGKRMTESKQLVPHFYVSTDVDMAAAVAFRAQANAQVADDASKISFNDLTVKACAVALRDFPNLNTSLEGDQLHDHANIDVNIAVAIEGGLIAPFIPDADQKSLGAVARMAKDLVGRARSGGLKPEEYQGGTFTVSNL
ncbi:MAG: 2-oxo acid dehydrogenase subunit E2, partial [Chloroflexota bacterium]|nr:2-oxo acid dehydrogenase subunit E2 [Chloroflexota bacterium]